MKDGKVAIKVNRELLNKNKVMPMAKRDPNDKRIYTIIGGGPAGLSCAEALRQGGFTG